MTEHQVKELIREYEFIDPPPDSMLANDYVTLGEQQLRRRRVTRLLGVAVGAVLVGAGVSVALPVGDSDGPSRRNAVAAAPRTDSPHSAAESVTRPPLPESSSDFEFPATRELLLAAAIEHFDPQQKHLPAETSNVQTGSSAGVFEVGTKLSWTNSGESGEGMVQVSVTSPGYVDTADHALENLPTLAGDDDVSRYFKRGLPGTGLTGWVYEGSGDSGLLLSVICERPDGSLVAVGVHRLFGNNSIEPVSDIGIDLETAAAFVADPRLEIAPADLAAEQRWADFADWLLALSEAEQQQVIDELAQERPNFATELRAVPELWDKLDDWGLVNEGKD